MWLYVRPVVQVALIIYLFIHAHLHLWQQWLMVQFDLLKTYSLIYYTCISEKGDADGQPSRKRG